MPTIRLYLALAMCLGAAAEEAAAKPPEVGQAARELALQTIDGQTVDLKALVAEGPVAVVMLRGWVGYQCPMCNQQVGDLLSRAQAIREAGGQVVLVYPGPADGLDDRAKEFVSGKNLPEGFHFVLDPDMKAISAWGLRWDAANETAYPATFVIAPDGKVRFAKVSQSHGDRATGEDILAAMKAIAK